MPFWNRRDKETVSDVIYVEQTARQVQQELAAGEDPSQSIAVDMMLKWLWRLDEPKVRAIHRTLCGPDSDISSYGRFLSSLPLPASAEPPASPYPVVAAALREFLLSALRREQTPLGEREFYYPMVGGLADAVWMVRLLRMSEAHDAICRLLFAANYRVQTRWNDPGTVPGISSLPTDQQLKNICIQCLLKFPPNELPFFWAKLKALQTARDLRPVVARMRDRRAVDYLLESLPYLDEDGQGDVIVTLGNIRDMRAVPMLQEIAADRTKLIAPIAAQALAEILRHSKEDAAILLRPTDMRHGGKAAETLLRPAEGAPDAATRPDQLLRAGERPPDKTKEEPGAR